MTFSILKRSTRKQGSILKERALKLLIGFIFGLVIVAIPANFFINVNFRLQSFPYRIERTNRTSRNDYIINTQNHDSPLS